MSWWPILLVSFGAYGFKALGVFGLSGRAQSHTNTLVSEFLPVAMLCALVALSTFADGRHLSFDARAVGLGCAALAVWRKAPFWVVVLVAVVVTAVSRAAGL